MTVSDKYETAAAMVPAAHAAHDEPMNRLSPRSAAFVMTVVLAGFLFFLAARGLLAPGPAARGFGIAVVDPADLFYLHVKADRDLSSALALVGLLWVGHRRALGAFVAAATMQPVLDAALSIADPRGHVGYALLVHGSAAGYGVVLAWLLLRNVDASAQRA